MEENKQTVNEKNWAKEMLAIAGLALVIGIVYNMFNSEPIDIVPKEVENVDSEELFGDEEDSKNQNINNVASDNTELDINKVNNNDRSAKFEIKPTGDANGFPSISYGQIVKAIGDDRFVILDARTPEAFSRSHIDGAINLFPHENDQDLLMNGIMQLPQDKKYLVYCNGPLCDLGHELAMLLQDFGYQDIYIFVGGWEKWIEMNTGKKG
ncbi:MAG: hypothetical protein Kapaf2KO_01710 [Candidatus Kapaibacteriales bacterium]